MRKVSRFGLAAAALLASAAGAFAEEGFARTAANLRAGPDFEYPVIGGVGPGEPVFVHGCLSDYSWCDVRARRERGWMQASRIELQYAGRRVIVPAYAPRIGVPVVRFDIGTYWDRHYRDYGWYRERDRYERRWVERPRDYDRREIERFDDRRYEYGRRDPRPNFERYEREGRRERQPEIEREVRREQPQGEARRPPVGVCQSRFAAEAGC